MAEKNDLRDLAQRKGIEIVSFCLPAVQSMSAEINGRCFIGLDDSAARTTAEEQACIGHELGHCLYGGFYTRDTPFDLRERHEVRADRWYIRQAIPREVLFELLDQGRDAWEIAEQLDTTEAYVRQAYYYYKENG